MHLPVMVNQVTAFLAPRPGAGGCYIDATIGGGGHAEALLEMAGSGTRLLGIDRDPAALERAAARLRPFSQNVCLRQGCFADLETLAASVNWPRADGILMDLGISSDQLADPERGFSFLNDGPLDMRMHPAGGGPTAADLLAQLEETALSAVFRDYGGEPAARRIARRIVRERGRAPITRTSRLASLIAAAKGGGFRAGHHPATRCFQALRIAVNREMEQLDAGLEAALRLLRIGGRLAVISFHSLEDRRVKECFRRHAGRNVSLPAGGSVFEFAAPRALIVTRRRLKPPAGETLRNPRARSAGLRVAQKEDDNETENGR